MTWVAAFAAACSVWWLLPEGVDLTRREGVPPPARVHRPRRRLVWFALAAAVALVASAVVLGPGAAAVVLACGQVVACVAGLAVRREARRARTRARAAVVHAGELVAGLLRVGRVPSAALVEAAGDAPVLREAAAELRAGGEVAQALRRSARGPGQEGLRDVAAAWDVSIRTGGSLVGAVDAAAARLAAQDEVARVVDAELAAARLAGRVMAVLPLVGLALGFGFGGNPLAFLTGSALGWACLNVGVGLACAGVWWIDTVAQRSGGR